MPIRPSWKKSWMRSFSKTPLFVHLFHMGTNLLVRELADIIAEEDLVFGEGGQWGGQGSLQSVGHGGTFVVEMGRIQSSIPGQDWVR